MYDSSLQVPAGIYHSIHVLRCCMLTKALHSTTRFIVRTINTMATTATPTAAAVSSNPPGTTLYQLFDGKTEGEGGTSTFTYLISCNATKECILIDPVLEQVERDSAFLESLGLTLTLCLNTHCHADHITGSGALKKKYGSAVRSCISAASGAQADVLLEPNQQVAWGKDQTLAVLATPGHTAGCLSFYDPGLGVFTGDALMINGCGRTDFQEGSAEQLYTSVHTHIFSLPDATVVYPGHDYKGKFQCTVGVQKVDNPRLNKNQAEFVQIMADLNLSYPGKIDVAVPANMKCGVF